MFAVVRQANDDWGERSRLRGQYCTANLSNTLAGTCSLSARTPSFTVSRYLQVIRLYCTHRLRAVIEIDAESATHTVTVV